MNGYSTIAAALLLAAAFAGPAAAQTRGTQPVLIPIKRMSIGG